MPTVRGVVSTIDTIYLDTCVLNRLTDDLSQTRVREEAVAVSRIMDTVLLGKARWITISIVRGELERNKDVVRRVDSLRVHSQANETLTPTPRTLERARGFAEWLAPLDALHLSICEEFQVDWLLTTDDRFLRGAARLALLRPKVVNPVEWLQRRQPWLLKTK